jgi:hypothetical protein
MIAAAGVSLSKQTMHRAHDQTVETFNSRATRWVLKPGAIAIPRRLSVTPFVSGGALIWATFRSVKRKYLVVVTGL